MDGKLAFALFTVVSDPLALTGSDAVNQVSDKLRHVIAFSITFWYVLESGG